MDESHIFFLKLKVLPQSYFDIYLENTQSQQQDSEAQEGAQLDLLGQNLKLELNLEMLEGLPMALRPRYDPETKNLEVSKN